MDAAQCATVSLRIPNHGRSLAVGMADKVADQCFVVTVRAKSDGVNSTVQKNKSVPYLTVRMIPKVAIIATKSL